MTPTKPVYSARPLSKVLEDIAGEAAAAGVLVHSHAAESRQEGELVRGQTGLDNVEYFHDVGLAGNNLFLAHCIWLSDREIGLMRESRTRITHCPGSNLKLASGIADITRYRQSGLHVSLGADGAACNNTLSVFQEMKLAGLLQTVKHGAAAIAAPDIFRMATIDGARDLNLETEIGSLEEGKRADIVLFDPRGLALEGQEDVYSTLVYAGAAENITHVIVDGRLLIEGGKPVGADPVELARRGAEELRRLLPRAGAHGFR